MSCKWAYWAPFNTLVTSVSVFIPFLGLPTIPTTFGILVSSPPASEILVTRCQDAACISEWIAYCT